MIQDNKELLVEGYVHTYIHATMYNSTDYTRNVAPTQDIAVNVSIVHPECKVFVVSLTIVMVLSVTRKLLGRWCTIDGLTFYEGSKCLIYSSLEQYPQYPHEGFFRKNTKFNFVQHIYYLLSAVYIQLIQLTLTVERLQATSVFVLSIFPEIFAGHFLRFHVSKSFSPFRFEKPII